MAIDKSPLTLILFFVFSCFSCFISYKKNKNLIRVLCVFLWALSIYNVFSYCILPIQFTHTIDNMPSFYTQFSIMTLEQFKRYFLDYIVSNASFFASFIMFGLFTSLLYKNFRNISWSFFLIISVLCVHLIYNVSLNLLLAQIIKSIRGEDFVLMIMGYFVGWLFAKTILKFFLSLDRKLSVKQNEA